MDNLEAGIQGHMVHTHNEYNEIPVEYCAHCLSLAIMDVEGTPYCSKCGSTDIKKANIFDWENLYKTRYGKSYIGK